MQKMKNLKTRKLYLQVYDELKQYIQENHLQPGDKLPTELEMCALLGVSRNVLREAVKSLEITGVVHSRPGVGIIIQKFSPDYMFSNFLINLAGDSDDVFWQMMEVRRALELSFAEHAYKNIGKQQYEELCSQVNVMQKTLDKCKAKKLEFASFGSAFAEADAHFHKALFSNVNNTILHAVMNAVWIMDTYFTALYPIAYMERTVERHKDIVRALEQNDLAGFIEAINRHFDSSYKPEPEDKTSLSLPWRPLSPGE